MLLRNQILQKNKIMNSVSDAIFCDFLAFQDFNRKRTVLKLIHESFLFVSFFQTASHIRRPSSSLCIIARPPYPPSHDVEQFRLPRRKEKFEYAHHNGQILYKIVISSDRKR